MPCEKDGSLIEHSDVELLFAANGGLGPTVEAQRTAALTHNVPFGDIVQFAAAVGVSNCAGAPRLEFMAGRPTTSQASPAGLVPGPGDTVDRILERMADAGFSADETVDLLASHSIAAQQGLNTALGADHALMSSAFRAAMVKLATLGNNRSTLVDCSSVIPTPASAPAPPTIPGGKTLDDIEGSCAATPFPSLPIAPGPTPTVPAVAV
ncbi:hypothetical protein D9611_000699 [Ephemerocybe angulata]|uniref:Plant heme peroxidase family profile domain-containing protein n=1 Tax=Ephemerocybe angulata TaxID=980116 RepID=A0A8H5F7A9_9AGAR|nr:hypothetical protein D9611_000699 [Tulosesus angulatus]